MQANEPAKSPIHQKHALRLWRLMVRIASMKMPAFPQSKLTDAQKQQIKQLLQPGDLILDKNNIFLLPTLTNRVLFRSNSIHVAIYSGGGFAIDAGRRPFVAELPVECFLNTTGLAVYRPNYQSSEDVAAMLSYARNVIGTPFNIDFDQLDSNSFYCGQLVARALQAMPNPIVLPAASIFGRVVTPPAAVEQSPDTVCVCKIEQRLLPRIGAHWPSLAAAWLGGSYAHMVGLGSLAGAVMAVAALALIFNVPDRGHQEYRLIE